MFDICGLVFFVVFLVYIGWKSLRWGDPKNRVFRSERGAEAEAEEIILLGLGPGTAQDGGYHGDQDQR